MLNQPIELAALVRAVAFRLLVTHGEPIAHERLAEATGVSTGRLALVVGQQDNAGRIRRDPAGRVVGSAGLSVIADRHQIDLEGRRFWTWCAYDILGIFGALSGSGHAVSPSPPDRDMIEVRFAWGRPQQSDAVLFRPDAELMDSCQNVYQEWCPNSNLFARREMAEAWASKHRISGSVLSLDEAADLATDDWKPLTQGLVLNKE